ncbi:MAG: glycine--tRNA ligase subunit beta [Thermodesulfobacteriota bacterium]
MDKELLLEIGTEEIPSGVVPQALKDLEILAEQRLTSLRINHKGIKTMGTPRRLILYIERLSDTQQGITEEKVGPPKRIAYDNEGNPTKTAIGFAKSQGVNIKEIKIVKTDKGEYLSIRKESKGQKSIELLPSILKDIITSLPFPKSMRWGSSDLIFARPIHWILAIFDGAVVPFELDEIKGNVFSRGHCFINPAPFRVKNLSEYLKKTRSAYVIVDPNEREQMIREGIRGISDKTGGAILEDEDLIKEVAYLVEYPVVLHGSFNDEFLKLPQEVLIHAMRNHQRYFSMVDDKGDLLPCFITVANTPVDNADVVIKGNERVIKARLEDARFYFEKDQKVALKDMAEGLKGVIFQAKLGTSYEKAERFAELAIFIGLSMDFCNALHAQDRVEDFLDKKLFNFKKKASDKKVRNKWLLARAAMLSKADLVSNMVGEFPDLQGTMGKEYALLSGEPKKIADAIYEHYLPTPKDNRMPDDLGAIIGIADKLDTIVGCFGIGIAPTGTADPQALRRQTLSIISIVLGKGFTLELDTLVDKSIHLLKDKLTKYHEDVKKEVLDFFKGRLQSQLLKRGYSFDTVDAVLSASWYDMADAVKRVKALESFKKKPVCQALAIAFKRVSNILKGYECTNKTPDIYLFEEPVEERLYDMAKRIGPDVDTHWKNGSYEKIFETLASLKITVDGFFDDVMVMVDDERLKNNRLLLLSNVRGLYSRIADISKLVV